MSVIESAGSAAGKGIESTGKGFSEATEGLPWWAKGLIIAGAIGGGLYIVYYIAQNFVSGITGSNCNQQGSACYNALQPYINTYQTCAQQYAYYLNKYLEEDAANGTGFTSAQLSQLNYLTNCMNNASENIANTAKNYNNDPITVIQNIGMEVGGIIGGAYGLSLIIKALKTPPSNGSTFSSIIRNALLRQKVANGEITIDQASGLVKQSDELKSTDISTNDTFYNDLADEDIITADEADTIRTETDEDMAVDDTDTEDILSDLFE